MVKQPLDRSLISELNSNVKIETLLLSNRLQQISVDKGLQ